MRIPVAAFLVPLLGQAGIAFGGACPDPRDAAFMNVGRVVAPDAPTEIQLGVDHVTTSGWPDCRQRREPVPARWTLGEAAGERGPFAPIAAGSDRKLLWTPHAPGIHHLRLDAGPLDATVVVVVAAGTAPAPLGRKRADVSADLWLGSDSRQSLRLGLRSGDDGVLPLPGTPASWRLTGAGIDLWAQVAGDGQVTLTQAQARVTVRLAPVTRDGWLLTAEVPGVPPLETQCRDDCALAGLPPGKARVHVRALPGGPDVPIEIGTGDTPHVLDPMRMIGDAVHDDAPAAGACNGAVPFDAPDGPRALGAAICAPGPGGALTPRTGVPHVYARGPATAPIVAGGGIVWAESTTEYPRAVVLFTFAGGVVSAEAVPPAPGGDACHAAGITALADGTLVVGGSCGEVRGAMGGFFAERPPAGAWSVIRRPGVVTALAGELAIEEGALVRRARRDRWRAAGEAPEALIALAGGRAIGRSGAVYDPQRRLERVARAPAFDLDLVRVAAGARGTIALFNRINGSEYHPFCVRSVVAELGGDLVWRPVHRVEGDHYGYDCQDRDVNPVVVDVAVAGGTIYARRRARFAGVDRDFTPLLPP